MEAKRAEVKVEVKRKGPKVLHLLLALVILSVAVSIPTPEGLSVPGHRAIAVMLFAVYLWVTEAVPYAISAIFIIFFMTMLLGFSPDSAHPEKLLGTSKALPIAMSGFVNPGWVLVAAGIFIAEGIKFTGLDKRIALNILKIVGAKPNRVIAGVIIIGYVLAFIIPSVAARAATIVPLAFGLVAAFNVDRKSNFARYLMVTAGMISPIAGFMLLTAGATNPVAAAFIANIAHETITWGQWAVIASPLSLGLGILLYFLVTRIGKLDKGVLPGGSEYIHKALRDLGDITPKEKRVAMIFLVTIILWATESIHHIDSNTVAVFAVLLIFTPYLGVATWKELASRADWGTLVLFGAGITIGEVLLKTGAAVWMAEASMGSLGLGSLSPAVILICLTVPLLIIRLAFASIAAFVSACVPAILGFLVSLNNPDLPMGNMALLSTFIMYYSFLLPVNTPSALMAYSTDTYELKDMLRVGVPLTVLGLGLFILMVFTYWSWIGVL